MAGRYDQFFRGLPKIIGAGRPACLIRLNGQAAMMAAPMIQGTMEEVSARMR